MSRASAGWPVRLLLVLGGVLAGLGLVAGHLNRVLLDGPTFAAKVDELRKEPAVAHEVGTAISVQLVRASPDLVAIRPLVANLSAEVAASDLLSAPVQAAARQAHAALTDPGADAVVLRIADAGAIVAGALSLVAPDAVPNAADVSVTLAEIGDQSFASATLTAARLIGVLAWLLPLLALASLAGAVLLLPDRWLGASRAGVALVAAAGGVGAALVVGGFLIRQVSTDSLGGAVAAGAWTVFVRPLWWSVVVLAAAGLAIAAAAGSAVPGWLDSLAGRTRTLLVARPATARGVAVRALAAVVVGAAAVLDPAGLLELLAVLAGAALVVFGLSQLSGLGAAAREQREERAAVERQVSEPARHPWPVVLVAGVAVVALVAGVAWLARPGRDAAAPPVSSGDGCNGHPELCDRRFDEVAYVSSHNSMSVAREPGWFIAEQVDPIPVQLDQGVRALLVDVWPGRQAGSVVRTAEGAYAEAAAVVSEELGPELVDAARRLADSVAGVAEGPEELFMCHGLCEIGATSFRQSLAELRAWLAVNPREVVTLFIEDHVPSDRIAADVTAAGLLPSVFAPVSGQPFPTLREMIDSGRRLVVMVEEGDGGPEAPWLVNGFEFTQDTPYTFPTVESFSCDDNRGPGDAPLFLLNHWLSGFSALVTNAQKVNALDVLLPRAQECQKERGQIPNFVAVNYTALGDVNQVVDLLNGVAEEGG